MTIRRIATVLLASAPAAAVLAGASGCQGRIATAAVSHRVMSQMGQSHHPDVASANTAFYAALNGLCAGSAEGMAGVWSHEPDVSDFGPDGKKHVGWAAVEAQFQKEAAMKMGGTVTCEDVRIVQGSDFGIVTCTERGRGMTIDGKPTELAFRSTNVFRKEGDGWKLVHHHTDPSVPMEARK